MTATKHTAVAPPLGPVPTGSVRWPILRLLHPHEHARLIAVTGFVATIGAVGSRAVVGWELWQAVLLVLVVMAVPAALKWRADAHRFGVTATVAGALITVQGLHTVEHLSQWVQRHVLHESLRDSNGLLSPANSEWVHFLWNWSVLIAIVFLVFRGMRGFWGWALLLWAFAHTLEHTYMFIRYLEVLAELRALGFDDVTAQGLPGVVGAGGWIDLNSGRGTSSFCSLILPSVTSVFPSVTSADRVDAHFVWNAGEVLLALPAVHALLRGRVAAFKR